MQSFEWPTRDTQALAREQQQLCIEIVNGQWRWLCRHARSGGEGPSRHCRTIRSSRGRQRALCLVALGLRQLPHLCHIRRLVEPAVHHICPKGERCDEYGILEVWRTIGHEAVVLQCKTVHSQLQILVV